MGAACATALRRTKQGSRGSVLECGSKQSATPLSNGVGRHLQDALPFSKAASQPPHSKSQANFRRGEFLTEATVLRLQLGMERQRFGLRMQMQKGGFNPAFNQGC